MAKGKEKIYLLGGNGSSVQLWQYSLPYFNNYDAVPVSPPGHDNSFSLPESLDELAYSIIRQAEENNYILAAGINALAALRAQVLVPGHFKKIILLSPVGAYLWKRKFVKYLKQRPIARLAKYFITGNDFFLKRKLAESVLENEKFELIKESYRKCNSFENYFKIINPYDALDLVEWLEVPVHIMWGKKDKIADYRELPAWEGILAGADLTYRIYDEWGHHPYLENPQRFAKEVEKCLLTNCEGFNKAHTKGSRIKLAGIAGINIPNSILIKNKNYDENELRSWLKKFSDTDKFAVRSSNFNEDTGESNAGLFKSFIRIDRADVSVKVMQLLNEKYDEVLVQEFIEPEVSGVAFARNISCEIEWVHGHLSDLLQGKAKPFRAVISKMKGEWEKGWNKNMDDTPFAVMLDELAKFLRHCISKFHYRHSDIEWAWNGDKFYLLQIRPVTVYNWHRFVTSANLDEILPGRVSRLMDYAQRRAAESISRVYSLWDDRVIEDNEPFTSVYDNASYINCDLFLSRFRDWGLPSKLFNSEIGGASPKVRFNVFRFMKNIPGFVKMLLKARRYLLRMEAGILKYEEELESIKLNKSRHDREFSSDENFVNWFTRYYLFIVRSNIILKACLSSAGGRFMGSPETVYAKINKENFPHRLRYESDPAVARVTDNFKPLTPFPEWNRFVLLWHKAGLPGMRGKYIEVREWFRDNNMRLFQKLHGEMKGSQWLEPSEGTRYKTGSFWQDEGDIMEQDQTFIIYPGKAEGIAGKDVMLVETVEAGLYEEYKAVKAVIAKTGGKLSHGAILLRELKKPSAVIGDLDMKNINGKLIVYDNGRISLK